MAFARTALTVAGAVLPLLTGCGDNAGSGDGRATSAFTVSFGSYGPLNVGMNRQQVLDASPIELGEQVGPHCQWLVDRKALDEMWTGALSVTFDGDTGLVVGISPPADARTDRGVGLGSTRDEVLRAYPDRHEEGQNQTGDYLVVTGEGGAAIGFDIDEQQAVSYVRTGTPDYAAGYEICSG